MRALVLACFLCVATAPILAHAQPPAPEDRGGWDRDDRRDDDSWRWRYRDRNDDSWRDRGDRRGGDWRWRNTWRSAGLPDWCWDGWGRFRWDNDRCRWFWRQQQWRWGNQWGWGWR